MTTDTPDLNALAIEACDMWQEHLSNLAHDKAARAELTRFLEPQRRMFAEWTAMMQRGATSSAATPTANGQQDAGRHDSSTDTSNSTAAADAPQPAPPPRGDDDDGDALRVAQLAYRVAELEKRILQLESLLQQTAGTARRTQRATS